MEFPFQGYTRYNAGGMWALSTIIVVALAVGSAGCATAEREWMKPGQPYTTQEFRRDHAACSSGRKLDERCMRSRGWVDVSPGREVKSAEPEYRKPPPGMFGK